MKSLFFAALAASVAAGCGDVIPLGNVTADGGAASPGDAASPGSPDVAPTTPPDPSCIGASDTPEMLLDTSAAGGGEITDFAGDGRSRVYVAMNRIADFQAGRVLDLPHRENTNDEMANVSPSTVEGLGLGLGHVAFDVKPASEGQRQLQVVARDAAPNLLGSLYVPEAPRLATHPSRTEVAYFDRGAVRLLRPPGTSNPDPPEMMLSEAGFEVPSLAMNSEGTVIALMVGTAGTFPVFRLVRKALMPGGGPFAIVASATATALSNVAVDETSAYIAMRRDSDPAATLVKVPLSASAFDPTVESVIATLPSPSADSPGALARIVTTAKYVYVDRGLAGPCPAGPCTAPLTLIRVAKTGPAALENVLSFTGPSAQSGRRAFNVDACYLYWSDGSKLWRKAAH